MQHIVTVEASGSSVVMDVSAIPDTFDDLLILLSLRSAGTSLTYEGLNFRLGATGIGLSTTGYSNRRLQGTGSEVFSYSATSGSSLPIGNIPTNLATSNTFGNIQVYIPNYASSVAKSISADNVQEDNATIGHQTITAGLWDNTAVIDRFRIFAGSATNNFVAGSSISVYGIKSGSSGGVTVS